MILFTKDIPQDVLLYAYNNNVVRFETNTATPILNATVVGLGINITLYPSPTGSFYFNLKDYISAAINTQNFADLLDTDLISQDPDTFTYDVTDGSYLEGGLTFTINFTDETSESEVRSLKFLAGVVQLESYRKQTIPADADYVVLSPVSDRSNNTVYLKYWEGYPFEFSFYTSLPEESFTLQNLSNGLDYAFDAKGAITSLQISDGRTSVTLEDFLPLLIGRNNLTIEGYDINISLDKEDADCGTYVKWRNHLGRWNYWLFNKKTFRDRSAKSLKEINTDFENIEDTFAPTTQRGRTSQDTIKCNSGKLYDYEKELLIGILDSPKIYVFTGDRFAKADVYTWVEVVLKTSGIPVQEDKKKSEFVFEFEMPQRYNMIL